MPIWERIFLWRACSARWYAAITVLSGLFSARMVARFGTARVTAVSVLMTAAAMLGMALSCSFSLTLLLCVPLGLGGGAVDAALNNFVALHYQARHMNWLHCFWGPGATLGPAVIGLLLRLTDQWRGGYLGDGGGAMRAGCCDVCPASAMAQGGRRYGSPERGARCPANEAA